MSYFILDLSLNPSPKERDFTLKSQNMIYNINLFQILIKKNSTFLLP